MRNRIDINSPEIALLALGLATAILLLVPASTSTAAFGAFNSAWEGTSDLRKYVDQSGADAAIVRNTNTYTGTNPNETLAVIISPERAYNPSASASVEKFVRQGGTLVVADDFGQYSNQFLRDIGARARLDGRLVRDERYNHRFPAMPVARNVSNHTLTTGMNALVLNHGTVVRPHNSTVLVETSRYAYLDENRNGEIDDSETITSFPVATVEDVGRGRVVVIGDPSLFTNAMLDRRGNGVFFGQLLDGHQTVFFDYSHGKSLPPFAAAILLLRNSVLLQLIGAFIGVGTLAMFSHRNIRAAINEASNGEKNRECFSLSDGDEELVDYLNRRHPEWDADRIERIVHSFQERRSK